MSLVALVAVAAGPVAAQELPELPESGMVVPWADFKEILEQLRGPAPTPTPAPPPVAFAMSSCEMTATVGADERQVQVAVSFTVEVLEDADWVEIPVLAERVALESATMDGEPARMYRQGGHHTVALRGRGRHRFELSYLVAVSDSRGTRTARLTAPPAPVVALALTVPRGDVDLQVDGAVTRSVIRRAGQTRVRAAQRSSRDTAVSWFPRVTTDDRGAKVFAELATLVAIGEGVLRGTTTASFSIHGRGVDTFRLEVPADLTVLEVDAHGVRDWRMEDAGEGRRLLEVQLNYLATGDTSFSVRFEMPLGGATVDLELPDIGVRDVLRERGFVAVAAATNVEITPADGLENAAPVDPAELPDALLAGDGDSVLYAFKYLRHPVVIPLEVVKHQDVAVKRTIVDRAELRTFLNAEGRMIASAVYTVKNNRKQYLEMRLPEGARLWAAYLEDRPVKAAQRDDGVLLVPLKKSARDASGALRPFTVEAVYYRDGGDLGWVGSRHFAAPALDVDVLELSWDLYLPRSWRFLEPDGNVAERSGSRRLVVIGDQVYNLADAADLAQLEVATLDGESVITDGAGQVGVNELRVEGAGESAGLSSDDLKAIGEGAVAKDASREGAPAADEPEEQVLGLERDVRPMTQGLFSNVISGPAPAAGGQAVGVLPVRIPVPADGVRLQLEGRLLTTGDTPEVRMRYLPASWRLPRLGRLWAVILGFVLAAIATGLAPSARAGALAAAVGLVLVLLAAPGHRLMVVGAALTAVIVVAWWSRSRSRDRAEVGGGF